MEVACRHFNFCPKILRVLHNSSEGVCLPLALPCRIALQQLWHSWRWHRFTTTPLYKSGVPMAHEEHLGVF